MLHPLQCEYFHSNVRTEIFLTRNLRCLQASKLVSFAICRTHPVTACDPASLCGVRERRLKTGMPFGAGWARTANYTKLTRLGLSFI